MGLAIVLGEMLAMVVGWLDGMVEVARAVVEKVIGPLLVPMKQNKKYCELRQIFTMQELTIPSMQK